jgi:hypothetical protein
VFDSLLLMLACATCTKLFGSWYDTTEYYVTLLERQNRMLLKGQVVAAGELDGAIIKARAVKRRALQALRKHQTHDHAV